MGYCNFCGRKAGFLRSKHKECKAANTAGRQEMVELATQYASDPDVGEATLRKSLEAIAERCFIDQQSTHAAVAQGWQEAVAASVAMRIPTQEKEARLRALRKEMGIETDASVNVSLALLDKAAQERLVQQKKATWDRLENEARQAALTVPHKDLGRRTRDSKGRFTSNCNVLDVNNTNVHLSKLEASLKDSGLSFAEQKSLLVTAWEKAAEIISKRDLPTLDEEKTLVTYLEHFNIETH